MKPCWMLPKILVVSATAFKVESHALAIQKTMEALPFHSNGLLISTRPPLAECGVEWMQIPSKWIPRGSWNREEYSRFMLGGLADFVMEYDRCITVQWDGYAVNRERWSNEFLEYDYIGAPWPRWMNIGRVGNGGFSIRSREWIAVSAAMFPRFPFHHPEVKGSEDSYSCKVFRFFYERSGMTVAPVSVASQWSIEHAVEEYPKWNISQSFGFHGFYRSEHEKYRLP